MTDSPEAAKSHDQSNEKKGTSWTALPETYGNYAGDRIEETLGVVGKPAGEGLSHVAAPVGNVVGGVVKPVMILGDTMNEAPQWGPRIETSARETAGNLVNQGKEALHMGQEGKAKAESGENDKGS